MNRPALRIVTFGLDQNIARRVCDRLRSRSIDAESYVVSNTPASDAEIHRIISSKRWDAVMIGLGVQQQREWYERVVKIVKSASPDIGLIQHQGPNELESAIEHHFQIQLPPPST